MLCYDLQIHSLADLNKLDEEKLKRFRLLPNFAKDRLRQLPGKVITTDFVYLAKVVVSSLFVYIYKQLSILVPDNILFQKNYPGLVPLSRKSVLICY